MVQPFVESFAVVELLLVTLFSLYAEIAFFFWMPFLAKIPPVLHLALQFVFIGLPQCFVILLPHFIQSFYFIFGIFAVIGAFFSYLRFYLVKRKISKSEVLADEHSLFFNLESGVECGLKSFSAYLDIVFSNKPSKFEKRSNTISLYQTCIMMMTITAISAVDFKCFPSRFRKSKAYGISLMDIGVALIITSSGLVMSKYLHGPSKLKFNRLMQYSSPLLFFGFFKAVLSSQFNIGAEEYGKHWNFFFNLAIIPFTLQVFNVLPSIHCVPVICFAYLIGFQYLLTFHGLSDHIFSHQGASLYSKNKVGIYSLGGYISLFNLSCYVGKLYQNPSLSAKKSICILLATTIALWLFFVTFLNIFLPSRPLANITYVVWGIANGSLHILLFSVLDVIFPEKYRFIIFAEMISEYRLQAFLLANIFSVIVKKVVSINNTSILYTLKIVASYITLTCIIVGCFFYRKHRETLIKIERTSKFINKF